MTRSLLLLAVVFSLWGVGVGEEDEWMRPKAPPPKRTMRGYAKIKVAPLREPRHKPPEKYFPVPEGRERANSIRWVRDLLNKTNPLIYHPKRLRNGCLVNRLEWRKRQVTGMGGDPLFLEFNAINGSGIKVTLPIERMGRLKQYNNTVSRAYVDPDVWKAERWVFFDLGARHFMRSKKPYFGSTFQFICGYPGAERFEYRAYDIQDLADNYPPFVKWTTAGIWNDTGTLRIKGQLGAGSHVLFRKSGDDSMSESSSRGSSSDSSSSGSDNSGSGSTQEDVITEVDALDFSKHLPEIVKAEDFVVLKIDVENAEFRVLDKLIETGAINLVDEIFIECHGELTREAYKLAKIVKWVPEAWVRSVACRDLEIDLRKLGIFLHEWD